MIRIANTLDKQTKINIFRLHKICLPDDILPNLYYKHYQIILDEMTNFNNGFFILSENNKKIDGALFIELKNDFIKKIALRYPFLTLVSLIKISILNPQKLTEIISIGKSKINSTNVDDAAEIFAFFISSDRQGKGLGTEMLKKAYSIMSDNNIKSLVTKTSSKKALEFYLGKGFKKITWQKTGHRIFTILLKKL